MSIGNTPFRYLKTQVVAYTATAANSSAVGGQTYAVRLVSSTACHVRINATTPTAVTTDTYLAANAPAEYVTVSPGDIVSAVQDSAGGNLYVTELTY